MNSNPSSSNINEENIGTLTLLAECHEEVQTAAESLLMLTEKLNNAAYNQEHMPIESSQEKCVAEQCVSATDVCVQVPTADLILARLNITNLSTYELRTLTGIQTLELLEVFGEFFKENIPAIAKRKCLTIKQQIILTFLRLNLNIKFVVLGIFFRISSTTCKTVFLDIVLNLAQLLAPCIPWCSREEVRGNMPKCFKANNDVRIIIDCTEVTTEKTKCLTCKINMYSHYKGKQTIKFLVSVSPAGLFTFLSKGYGGRASYKTIFEQSGFLKMLDPYTDEIIADKGFLIKKECAEHAVGLLRPSFSKKGRLTKSEAVKSRNIATVRVHVERGIQRLKIFNFLQDKIPVELIPEMDHILTVIVAMLNLSSPILSDEKFCVDFQLTLL